MMAGGLYFAAQRRTAPPPSCAAPRHRGARSLLRPGCAVLVGVNLAIGGFFGAMQISVTAFAVEHCAGGIGYITYDGAPAPIAASLDNLTTRSVTMTFAKDDLLEFNRDNCMYEWTSATPAAIVPSSASNCRAGGTAQADVPRAGHR